MAVSACFGTPSFNMLMGTGFALTYINISHYPHSFALKLTESHIIAFSCLVLSIISTMVFVPLNKFMVNKKYAVYLMVIYAAFTVMSILAELKIFKFNV